MGVCIFLHLLFMAKCGWSGSHWPDIVANMRNRSTSNRVDPQILNGLFKPAFVYILKKDAMCASPADANFQNNSLSSERRNTIFVLTIIIKTRIAESFVGLDVER